jgi:hypothetical protein
VTWSPFGKARSSGFADAVIASFPQGLAPPEPLVRLFRWIEAQRLDGVHDGRRYGRLDPAQPDWSMSVRPVDRGYVEAWMGDANPEAEARLAPFVQTGGDGSFAALWRDDAGAQRIVHLPSGSGSMLLCVLADDPVDFVRLLAIGYDELCWPRDFSLTPPQVHGRDFTGERDPRYFERHVLRDWVEASFGVKVPRTAGEIVTRAAEMHADESDDPFWQWMKVRQGW